MTKVKIFDKDKNLVGVIGGGADGKNGKSAYQIAVDNGFQGTEQDWLDSLKGTDGVGVPIGGLPGQVLAKKSSENYDTDWVDPGLDEVDLASDIIKGVLPVDKVGLPSGGLEGQALVKAGADSETPTKWGPWPSNPNLLINADFRNPVNRNGKAEYTGAGYTIDRWALLDTNASLTYDNGFIVGQGRWVQNLSLEVITVIRGQTITLSLLANGQLFTKTETIPSAVPGSATNYCVIIDVENVQTNNLYLRYLPNGIVQVTFYTNTQFPNLQAVKLELGNQQTLAHQDEDGNWVLNEPPNFDLQYALCSQYSPSTGEFVGSQHSNPNLLDNWYLADPINQRGQTEYVGSKIYSIDRWITYGLKVSINDNNLTLTPQENAGIAFGQPTKEFLFNKQLTLSVLLLDGRLFTGTGSLKPGSNWLQSTLYRDNDIRLWLQNRENDFQTVIDCTTSTQIVAVKLELGPVQTLAHKEGDVWVLNDPLPVKSVELAKCQEYQFVVGGGNNRHIGTFEIETSGNKIFTRIAVTLPTTQRKSTPAVKILGSGSLRLVQIANQIKAVGTISSTQQPESVFLSENCCYITYETPGLTAGMTGMVDTTNVSTFLCIDNNL